MSLHHTPWHPLTVTEVWYCDQYGQDNGEVPDGLDLPCRDEDGWCTGHAEGVDGRHSEVEHDLTHPADCESRTDYLDCLTADLVCASDAVLPTAPGAYRVRVRMRLPAGVAGETGASLEFAASQPGGAA